MVLAAFREATRLVTSRPVLWVPGIVIGLITAADLFLQYYGGSFLAGRLWIIEVLIVPFLFGGLLTAVKSGELNIHGLISGGAKYYFRILLPGLVILFAALVTILLLMVPLTIVGASTEVSGIIAGAAIGVLIPFIFLTYFYDAVAVFEDTKVFESIRRSIELAILHTGLMIKFFLVNIAVLFVGFFFILVAWSSVLLDRLTPLTTMNATELQQITPEKFTTLLGADGVMATAIIFAIGSSVLITVLYTYKACFFQELAGLAPAQVAIQGEFDSKGRWYKY